MNSPIRRVPQFQLYPVGQVAAYDYGSDTPSGLDRFIQLSIALTGFSAAELASTGMARAYFDQVGLTVGRPTREEFIETNLPPGSILTDGKWGPLAQNVIRMWYLGRWKRLPDSWLARANLSPEQAKTFDEFGLNVDRVISARAYQEGLAWRAAGINPMGAKQQGFASWAVEPT